MALSAGTRLGPYEVIAPLGAGGMGEVYKARDTRLDRTVAIKILPATLADDPEFRERFDREARVISQLDHPHICALFDVGEHNSTAFLVMQYLEGETLEDRIVRGPLSLKDALQIATDIAGALDQAHRAGIVHRDLKPGNVMLTKAGAKLLDFGLAKASAPVVAGLGLTKLATTPPTLTVRGTILGTFQYMAPEQLEGLDADARTDIFAFGAVLYEMLTGRKAFDGTTQASVIAAILEREPPPISATQPLTPAALDRTVKRCLTKDPNARWQTARDLLEELRWIATDTVPATPAVATSRARWRERAAWLIAAAAILAAVVIAVVYLRQAAPDTPVMRFEVATPPTSDPTSFALSPDGHQLVFVANADGVPALWLRPLDQTTAQPLAGTGGATYPFWAPDSRAIGFFADGKLKRFDLDGGVPKVLADAPSGRGGTWNRDGVILFMPNAQLGATAILMRVPATGGPVTPVTHLSASQASHRWPQFLPDGRRFLFFSGFGRLDTQGMYLGSLDGREPTRLLATETAALFMPPHFLLLVRQDALVALPFDPERGVLSGEPVLVAEPVGTDFSVARGVFSISPAGLLAYRAVNGSQRRQLVWMNRAGMVVGTVGPKDESSLADPELAPDGRLVVVRRVVQGNIDVWVMDSERGVPTPFTFDSAADVGGVWSPDGRRIIFSSNRGGEAFELFEKVVSGAGGEQPLHVEVDVPESPSPDGRFLLYSKTGANTGADLWALPMTGDRKPFPVLQTRFDERRSQFSPDGRWVAYESNDSGRFQIYVQPFPASGGKWQVSSAGGSQVRWRHDGKELFYVAPDQRLMAVPIAVAADGQTLNGGEPVPLFMTRLAQGAAITGTRSQYAVAADGRFLMNVIVEETAPTPPITVVVNWAARLKR